MCDMPSRTNKDGNKIRLSIQIHFGNGNISSSPIIIHEKKNRKKSDSCFAQHFSRFIRFWLKHRGVSSPFIPISVCVRSVYLLFFIAYSIIFRYAHHVHTIRVHRTLSTTSTSIRQKEKEQKKVNQHLSNKKAINLSPKPSMCTAQIAKRCAGIPPTVIYFNMECIYNRATLEWCKFTEQTSPQHTPMAIAIDDPFEIDHQWHKCK
jgi:hypothetical protein